MNMVFIDMVKLGGEQAADAVSDNPYVAGGMLAAGVLIWVGKWIHDRRKKRKVAPARPLVSER